MIHELREYTFNPEGWEVYRKLFKELCLPTRRNDYGKLVGCWVVDEVEKFRFFHVWQYESLDTRAQLRKALLEVSQWSDEFLPQSRVVLRSQNLTFMNPLGNFETVPNTAGPLYLHRINCVTGGAMALAKNLKEQFVWLAECPNPNQVIFISDRESVGSLKLLKTVDGIFSVESINTKKLNFLDSL